VDNCPSGSLGIPVPAATFVHMAVNHNSDICWFAYTGAQGAQDVAKRLPEM